MSKTIVTIIGLVISLGIIALAFVLVVVPLYVSAVGVDAQTATVTSTNAIYEDQIANLTEQEKDLDEITSNVDALRAQLPATAQLDDVFEVIARAADATQVTLTSITAGEQVVFVVRTGPDDPADVAAPAAPAPDATPAPGADGADANAAEATDSASADAVVAAGRQQVDFAISITAADMGRVTAFLDALRTGPRLLNALTSSATQAPDGTVSVQIEALTYVDEEG